MSGLDKSRTDSPVSEVEAAEFLGVTKFCLRSWRTKKTGVPYVRVGRLCRYRISDLQQFLDAHRVEPRGEKVTPKVISRN
jgi:hypothetical protein